MTFVPQDNIKPNTVVLRRIDSVYMSIECENDIAFDLRDHFTFEVPNARYHPLVKARKWDGRIRLFNPYAKRLYAGLWKKVVNFCTLRGYDVFVDPVIYKKDTTITPQSIVDFVQSIDVRTGGTPIIPRGYQLESVYDAMQHRRRIIVSPTGSGKSLNIYLMTRMMMSKIEPDEQILILVPTVGLVNQMMHDFRDYSASDDSFDADASCHCIYGGKAKNSNKKILISTWQSIYKNPKAYFDGITAIICDEVHLASAESIKGIMEKLSKCDYRIGLTGTLTEFQCNTIVLQGLFGIIKQYIDTAELIKQEKLSPLEIEIINFRHKYPGAKLDYRQELDFIVQHQGRNEFIATLATMHPEDNTLVIFNYVEKHGIPLYERICKKVVKEKTGHNVHLVYGDINASEREHIRQEVMASTGNIIVASYGVFQTGVNIPNLHNIIFTSPSKSRVRVLQTIGRQLRKHASKKVAKLYDLADHLGYKNITSKHMASRIKLYEQEKFPYKVTNINMTTEDPNGKTA